MPNFTYNDQVYAFSYNSAQSAIEKQVVSNKFNVLHSEYTSIIIPSGTGSGSGAFSVWVNNDREFITFNGEGYYTQIQGGIGYAQLQTTNDPNPSFSAHWLNITNHPCTLLTASAIYINQSFRWIRLQGGGLTANTTGINIAFMSSSNSEPGI